MSDEGERTCFTAFDCVPRGFPVAALPSEPPPQRRLAGSQPKALRLHFLSDSSLHEGSDTQLGNLLLIVIGLSDPPGTLKLLEKTA